MEVRRDKDQPLALRALLELENTQHRATIARVATQAVARLGGVGDKTAALEVGGKDASGKIHVIHRPYSISSWRSFSAYFLFDLRAHRATNCKELGGWKSRSMVDRYAKFATEHLAIAASRIETDRGENVLQLSRSSHVGSKAA